MSAGTSAAELPERLQDEPVPAIAVAPIPPEDPPGVLDLGGVLGNASWFEAVTWIVEDLAAQGDQRSTAAGGSPCSTGSCEVGSGGIDLGAFLILAFIVAVIAAAVITRSLVRRSGAVLTTR